MKWKMISLIIVGVCVAITSMILLQQFNFLYGDVYLFVAISFYPLAIIYGRSFMVDVFQSIKEGPFSPFKAQSRSSGKKLFVKGINSLIAFTILLFVGWIYGVYHAYQRYQMERGYLVK